jgi:hypothetical protein
MDGISRIWFTAKQRSELWARWKSGECVADIALHLASLILRSDGTLSFAFPKRIRQ